MNVKSIISFAAFTGALLFNTSCISTQGTAKGEQVGYTVANRYFFNNGAVPPASNKVTDATTFGQLFGMATAMGPDGQPTEIDFDKQFVIPVVLPETNKETTIKLGKLVEDGGGLTLYYKVRQGKQRSFTIKPLELIVVDGAYRDRPVTLKAQ